MKRPVFNVYVAALAVSSTAGAFSLYDSAPMVGIMESQPARYSFSTRVGYDTNSGGSTQRGQKASQYVHASLSTSYADVESVDKLSYNAHVGGSRYFYHGGNNYQRKYRADCGLGANFTHAFDAGSRYAGNVHVTYTPEIAYDNGLSHQGAVGDTLTWNVGNTYSQAIDSRWSWHVNAAFSGTYYAGENTYQDDRKYISCGAGLNYRESDLRTYTLSTSWRDELRTVGVDSQSMFATLGVQQALDAVSSCSASGGIQVKKMRDQYTANPTMNLGYQRRVSDGLSMSAYAVYSDENVDNYNGAYGASYRSTGTWRCGMSGSYVLSPDVSFGFHVQYTYAQQARPQGTAMPKSTRETIAPGVSMSYTFSPDVSGNISCEYSYYMNKGGAYDNSYKRWNLSSGLSYRF